MMAIPANWAIRFYLYSHHRMMRNNLHTFHKLIALKYIIIVVILHEKMRLMGFTYYQFDPVPRFSKSHPSIRAHRNPHKCPIRTFRGDDNCIAARSSAGRLFIKDSPYWAHLPIYLSEYPLATLFHQISQKSSVLLWSFFSSNKQTTKLRALAY